ncbi:MAG: DNA cytosine methyltransferase [Mariprofundaceae bacterium]|nr:DNA cytosine methyltransferase [Mariprofundaceae bacterium]
MIDGEGLLEDRSITDLYRNMIVLLMFGSTSTVSHEAGLLACEIGTLLGKTELLEKYVKERYINVSRITGGATANSLGQLAQKEVVSHLTQSLGNGYVVISNGYIDLDGYDKKGYLSCYDGRYNPVCGNMSFEVFKFLDPDGISITLTASDTNRLGIIQNNMPRRITPRECARLQGYPDTYQLLENDNAVYKQMGNGVSIPVVQAVLSDFIEHNYKELLTKAPSRQSRSAPLAPRYAVL